MDKWLELREHVEELVDGVEGTFGVAVKDLVTGGEFHMNSDELYQLASVLKVPVLVELYRQAEEGVVDLSRRYPVRGELLCPGSGVLKELKPGVELTLWDLALLMIIISDNTATDHVMDVIGVENINPTMRRLGLEQTGVVMNCYELLTDLAGVDPSLPRDEVLVEMRKRFASNDQNPDTTIYVEGPENNVSTPRELSRLLQKLVDPSGITDESDRVVVSTEGQAGILDIMQRQQLRQRIPLRLPRGTLVAHKTGTVPGVANDCGIVFADRDLSQPAYTIALCSKGLADPLEGADTLSRISKLVYDTVMAT